MCENKPIFLDIKNLFVDIINNIISKYIIASDGYPKRLTMISLSYCPICGNTNTDCSIIPSSEWNGRFNNYGWICCINCLNIVNIAKFYFECNKSKALSYKYYESNLYRADLSFWRVSSNKKISPYLENGFYNECCNDLFYISNTRNRLYCQISWYNDKTRKDIFNIYLKGIPLSNIIYHNREIFGYNIEFFYKINKTSIMPKRFSVLFNTEYEKANVYSFSKNTFQIINNKYMNDNYYLPNAIKKIIFQYLFDIY